MLIIDVESRVLIVKIVLYRYWNLKIQALFIISEVKDCCLSQNHSYCYSSIQHLLHFQCNILLMKNLVIFLPYTLPSIQINWVSCLVIHLFSIAKLWLLFIHLCRFNRNIGLPYPKQDTLSRHSILGPDGLSEQGVGSVVAMKV